MPNVETIDLNTGLTHAFHDHPFKRVKLFVV